MYKCTFNCVVEWLTEEDCQVLDLFHHGLQHGSRDQLNVGLNLQTIHPVLFFNLQRF